MDVHVEQTDEGIYVRFSHEPIAISEEFGLNRVVDLSPSGEVVGLELLRRSAGYRVDGLPIRAAVLRQALETAGEPIDDSGVFRWTTGGPAPVTRASSLQSWERVDRRAATMTRGAAR